MAVKGTQSKDAIFKKILETFPGSFMADAKTLRIPMVEDGETVEVKVTLTAAKDVLGGGAAQGAIDLGGDDSDFPAPVNQPVTEKEPIRVTEAEKANVDKLMEALNF